MKIGIFDSGIGGVSVLNEAIHRLPNENYIFYADVDHVPYGLKTSEQIMGYVEGVVSDLMEQGVDAIVIACNTATSVAAEHIRSMYNIPIIGMEPAVKPAVVDVLKAGGRVLVMATPVTIRENKLQSLLERVDKQHIVDLLPMPGLVRFAEAGIFDGEEVDSYIEEQLAVYDKSNYSEIVLGCTHFNYFKPAIKKTFGDSKVNMIDGNEGTIRHLAELLGLSVQDYDKPSLKNIKNIEYYESGRRVDDGAKLERFMALLDRLDEVRDI